MKHHHRGRYWVAAAITWLLAALPLWADNGIVVHYGNSQQVVINAGGSIIFTSEGMKVSGQSNAIKFTSLNTVSLAPQRDAVVVVNPAPSGGSSSPIPTSTIDVAFQTHYPDPVLSVNEYSEEEPVDPPTTYDISKATISIENVTYSGVSRLPDFTVTYNNGNTTLTENTDYTVRNLTCKDVDEYTLTIDGKGSYTGSLSAKFKVVPALLTVKGDTLTMAYGESIPENLSYTITGYVNGESINDLYFDPPTASTEATSLSPVGEYEINFAGGSADNYTFTYESGVLKIVQRPVTVKADTLFINYGDSIPELTYKIEGLVNGEDTTAFTVQPVITTEATATSPIGEYPITVSGGEATNYVFSSYVPAVLTIEPRALVDSLLTLTMDSCYAYTGDSIVPAVVVQRDTITLVEGTDYTLTATDNIEPGKAGLTIDFKGNYTGKVDTTFVIYMKPTICIMVNDTLIAPVVDELVNHVASATFESDKATIVVDNYYALPGDTVELTIMPKPFYYITKDSISGVELTESPGEQYVYSYVVPDTAVTLRAIFSIDSVALGIRDQYQYSDALQFTVINAQTVRVTGAKETAPVSVFDARGQQVAAEVSRNSRELLVRLARQPQGLYIIKVNNQSFKVYRK